MLLTYLCFFIDISSVLYEQPYNISVTIFHSCSEWSVLQNKKEEKTMKKYSNIKTHFLFFNEQPLDMWLNLLFE